MQNSGSPDRKTFLDKHDIKLERKLDSGGQASVYRGLRKGKAVAIKVIRLKDSDEEDIDREIKVLRQVKHPNIVRCDLIVRTTNKVWIVMELAAQGTIGKWVREDGPLIPWMARNLIQPCMEALKYLHSKNIAHRDLKLDNILLDRDMKPKLTDFGFSRFFDKKKDNLTETVCGTESYMPPEIHKHLPYDPMVADVWSLGICLYVMINGIYPFEKRDKPKMIDQMMKKKWSLAVKIDPTEAPGIKDLLSKMLQPEPKDRIKLDECLKHPWIVGPKNN